jgi:hypothetical protein
MNTGKWQILVRFAALTTLATALMGRPAFAEVRQWTWETSGIGVCKRMDVKANFDVSMRAEVTTQAGQRSLNRISVRINSSAFSVGTSRVEATISVGGAARTLLPVSLSRPITIRRFDTQVVLRWVPGEADRDYMGRPQGIVLENPNSLELKLHPSVSLPQSNCQFGWLDFAAPLKWSSVVPAATAQSAGAGLFPKRP